MVETKFCGLTREVDASFAAKSGASYIGVIFAGGPREISPRRAADVFQAAGDAVRRVGVFGADFRVRIPAVTSLARLDVVQLHADPTADDIHAARDLFSGTVWAAVRVSGVSLPSGADLLFRHADAVLLDPRVPGKLGGTGQQLPLRDLAPEVEVQRRGTSARLVLAGGLTAETVEKAIRQLPPQVVDVSSGVESAPGIKDHEKITAFSAAVRRSNR